MHNPMNRNPEENRPLDPFAAEETPETASETPYPVEADGEVHELTLAELMEAAAEGLSKRNAYVRRNRAANALPNGRIYAMLHNYRAMDMINFAVASSAIKHTIHGDANITDDVSTIRNLMNMNYDIKR